MNRSYILVIVLLMGGLFFETNTYAKQKAAPSGQSAKVIEDIYLFRVTDEVFSLNDMKKYISVLREFECVYPNSLLVKSFSKLINARPDSFKFESIEKPNFKRKQIRLFRSFMNFQTLMIYSRSHKVIIRPQIASALYLKGRKRGCFLSSFKSSAKLGERLEQIIRLEIFVRSRFIPEGDPGRTEYRKSVKSVLNLIKSINKQVDKDILWSN